MDQLLPTYKIIKPAISTAGVYYFTTDNGLEYEVRFGRKKDNILHGTIVFGVINDEFEGEEYTLTNKGELYRVMSTIVMIVRLYMESNPAMLVYEFTGIARDDEKDSQQSARMLLYKRYLPYIFEDNWNYDYSGGNTVLVLRKSIDITH